MNDRCQKQSAARGKYVGEKKEQRPRIRDPAVCSTEQAMSSAEGIVCSRLARLRCIEDAGAGDQRGQGEGEFWSGFTR